MLVNVAFRQSFLTSGNADAAYLAFIGWYALCFLVTWAVVPAAGAAAADRRVTCTIAMSRAALG